MNKPTLEQLEQQHEAHRSSLAREQYVNWRMRDVPSIYTNLMPYTYDAAVLWQAEKDIRAQIELDQAHLANPWRQIGPPSAILCFDGMSAQEQIEFASEVTPLMGIGDRPKPGQAEVDLRDEIRQRQEASPECAEYIKRRNMLARIAQETDPAKVQALRAEYEAYADAYPLPQNVINPLPKP